MKKTDILNMDIEAVIALVKSTKKFIINDTLRASIIEKGAADFVTAVDINVQNYLYKELKERFPDISFMGEESHEGYTLNNPSWILDPVDGTTNLIYDYKCSAVSLALYSDGEITLGIIYNTYLEEVFWAVRNKGAYLNDKLIHTNKTTALKDALVAVGTTPYDKSVADRNFAIFTSVYKKCLDIRRTGSAALDLAYVACGRQDAFFERDLKPWDFAAGQILIEEAGGKSTNWQRCQPRYNAPDNIIAAAAGIYDELMKEIHE